MDMNNENMIFYDFWDNPRDPEMTDCTKLIQEAEALAKFPTASARLEFGRLAPNLLDALIIMTEERDFLLANPGIEGFKMVDLSKSCKSRMDYWNLRPASVEKRKLPG